MASAIIAIDRTILHEHGSLTVDNNGEDFGTDTVIEDLREYAKKIFYTPTTVAEARIVFKAYFDYYKFDKYENQDVCNLLFDTFVHNKVIYYSIVGSMTGHWKDINRYCTTFKLDEDVYNTINKHVAVSDDYLNNFLGLVKFFRRRAERCYPTWTEKTGQHKIDLFTSFDTRVWSYPGILKCLPSQMPELYEQAKKIAAKAVNYEKDISYNMAYVNKNINYRITDTYKGIWGEVPNLYIIRDCVSPNEVQFISDNTTQSDDNVLQNAALGFLAVYIFKKIFL